MVSEQMCYLYFSWEDGDCGSSLHHNICEQVREGEKETEGEGFLPAEVLHSSVAHSVVFALSILSKSIDQFYKH